MPIYHQRNMRKALATLVLSIILLALFAVITTYHGTSGTGFSVLDGAADFFTAKNGEQIVTGKATPTCAEKYGSGYGCYKGSSCDKGTFKDPTGTTCAAQGSLYICCKNLGGSTTPTTVASSGGSTASTCSNPDHPFSCGGTCWNNPCQCGIACIGNSAQCLPCAQTSFAGTVSCSSVGGTCVSSSQQCPAGYEVNTFTTCGAGENCCVLAAATQAPGLAPPCGKYGDVDDNGAVTSVDALQMQRYLAGLMPTTFVANRADVDGNGKIESNDPVTVLSYVASTINTFPVCSKPDLAVSSPGGTINPIAGQPVTFGATISKSGAGGTGTLFKTKLAIDISNDNSPDIFPPEQVSTISTTYTSEVIIFTNAWTAVEGTHKFEICADSANDFTESNEDNNCVSMVFTVSPLPSCDEQTCSAWAASTCGSDMECLGKRMQGRTCSDTDCVTSRCVDDTTCSAPQTTTRVWADTTFYEYSGSGCANNNPDGWCPAIDSGSTNDRVAEMGFNLSHVSGTVNIARVCAYHYNSGTSSTSGQTTMNYITKTASDECDKPDQLSSPPLSSGSSAVDLRSGTFGWKCIDIDRPNIVEPNKMFYLRWWGDDLNGGTRPYACYRGPATVLLSGCGGSNPSGAQDCRPYLEITGALTVTATTSSTTTSTSSTTSSTIPCTNDCSPSGHKECQGTGGNGLPRYVATCGNYDADPCLEFSLEDCNARQGPAGPGFCSNGACAFAGTTTMPTTTTVTVTTTSTTTITQPGQTTTTTTTSTTTTVTTSSSSSTSSSTSSTSSSTTTTLQQGVTYSNFACSGQTCSVDYNNQAGQAIKVIYFMKDVNGAIVQIAQDANRPQGTGTSSITFICSTPGTYDVSAAFYANSETNYSNRLAWTKSYESQTVSC